MATDAELMSELKADINVASELCNLDGCEKCPRLTCEDADALGANQVPYMTAHEYAAKVGYALEYATMGFIKCCEACVDARPLAWLKRLDLERVVEFVKAERAKRPDEDIGVTWESMKGLL